VLECGAYGVVALDGGLVRTAATTIALNTKTGALARGKGARIVLGEGTTVEKNKMHGVGVDKGGAVTASKSAIRENAYVGVNVGDESTVQLDECLIHGNALHGIQVTAGKVEVSKSAITKTGKLGVFVNPPPAQGAAQPFPASDEQRRAWVRLDRVEVTSCGFFGVHVTGGYLEAKDVDVLQSGVHLVPQTLAPTRPYPCANLHVHCCATPVRGCSGGRLRWDSACVRARDLPANAS
jgi:hypothetical protein